MRKIALVAALICATPAAAQIVPGLRAPATTHDAMAIGQLFACTFAVTGRPSPVSSTPMSESEGLTRREAAPAEMLAAAGMTAQGTLVFTVDNPEGEVWLLNDEARHRCAVATVAGDLAANEAAFVASMERRGSDWRSLGGDPGARRYEARDIGLIVTLRAPGGPGAPFTVVTERRR